DDLLLAGYRNITLLDISRLAIAVTKQRLGRAFESIRWLCADVTQPNFPAHAYDVWHDRAVFHFLTDPKDRRTYVKNVASAVKQCGQVIVGTFGPEGPEKCSGLSVVRYDSDSLHDEFGPRFHLVESSTELHETPFGTSQQFVYCYCTLDA